MAGLSTHVGPITESNTAPKLTFENNTANVTSGGLICNPKKSDGVEMKSPHPHYVQTLKVKDANGQIKELIFPKGLDLDRPKRARTTFTSDQLTSLEREFRRNQYLVGRERSLLAANLGLSETQVKVWYQNRRTKHKRDREREVETSFHRLPSLPPPFSTSITIPSSTSSSYFPLSSSSLSTSSVSVISSSNSPSPSSPSLSSLKNLGQSSETSIDSTWNNSASPSAPLLERLSCSNVKQGGRNLFSPKGKDESTSTKESNKKSVQNSFRILHHHEQPSFIPNELKPSENERKIARRISGDSNSFENLFYSASTTSHPLSTLFTSFHPVSSRLTHSPTAFHPLAARSFHTNDQPPFYYVPPSPYPTWLP